MPYALGRQGAPREEELPDDGQSDHPSAQRTKFYEILSKEQILR